MINMSIGGLTLAPDDNSFAAKGPGCVFSNDAIRLESLALHTAAVESYRLIVYLCEPHMKFH